MSETDDEVYWSCLAELDSVKAQRDELLEACQVVSNWLVCYAIAEPDDLLQAAPEMLELLNGVIDKVKGANE